MSWEMTMGVHTRARQAARAGHLLALFVIRAKVVVSTSMRRTISVSPPRTPLHVTRSPTLYGRVTRTKMRDDTTVDSVPPIAKDADTRTVPSGT